MEYLMMRALGGSRRNDADDLARLWRPLVLKAALRGFIEALARLSTWPGWQNRHHPHFELSDRALHDIGLNRLQAERGAIRLLRR